MYAVTNNPPACLQERVLRSCAGEMEREVAAILSPLGIEESLSRRVAGSLLTTEASLSIPAEAPSMFSNFLKTISRQPKFSPEMDEERRGLLRNTDAEEDKDRGMTAFLLKFGEGMEEVSDSRLFISAFTIGASYFFGGLVVRSPF